MENINQYLEIVKREKKNKAKYDKNLNDYLRNQQNKYAKRLNPIMSQIYNMLFEIHKSIQGGVKTNNMRCEIKPPKLYGISGKKIKYNEIILSIDAAVRSMPIIGELKIIHDDIANPKIKIIATRNSMTKEQIIEIDKFDDDTMEEYIIDFLKSIFS